MSFPDNLGTLMVAKHRWQNRIAHVKLFERKRRGTNDGGERERDGSRGPRPLERMR
jgi:hypothetical protein